MKKIIPYSCEKKLTLYYDFENQKSVAYSNNEQGEFICLIK